MRLKQELHSKESLVVLLVNLGCRAWAGVNTWPTSVCRGKQSASQKVMEDGDAASGIRQELHHYNHYRRCRTRLPTNRHKVYKYCHLIVVMVIELLVNSPYNAVMSGRLLEAGHSLLCLYYELLIELV